MDFGGWIVRGKEWNFKYLLPQYNQKSAMLIVSNSLEIGWIKSPTYFCTALETACNIATQYIETLIGSPTVHKLLLHTQTSTVYANLNSKQPTMKPHSSVNANT